MDPSILYPVVADAVRMILPSEGDPLEKSLNAVFEGAVDDFIREHPHLGPVNESFLVRQDNLETILHRYLTYSSPMPDAADLCLDGYSNNSATRDDANRFLGRLEARIRAVPRLERILTMKTFIAAVSPRPRETPTMRSRSAEGTPLPPPGAECQEWLHQQLIQAGLAGVELLPLNFHAALESDPARKRVSPEEIGGEHEHLRYLSPVSAVLKRAGTEGRLVRALFTVLQRDLTAQLFRDLYDLFRVESFYMSLIRDVRSRNLPNTELNTLAGQQMPSIGVCIVAGRLDSRQYPPLARNRYATISRGCDRDRLVLHYFPKERESELAAVAVRGGPVQNTNPILFVASEQNQEAVKARIPVVREFVADELPAETRFSHDEED